jgi:hypothetical protein
MSVCITFVYKTYPQCSCRPICILWWAVYNPWPFSLRRRIKHMFQLLSDPEEDVRRKSFQPSPSLFYIHSIMCWRTLNLLYSHSIQYWNTVNLLYIHNILHLHTVNLLYIHCILKSHTVNLAYIHNILYWHTANLLYITVSCIPTLSPNFDPHYSALTTVNLI